MAINDSPYIVRGNQKVFAFELLDDDGKQVHDLRDVIALDFVLKDLLGEQVLLLTKSNGVEVDQPEHSFARVTIKTADSENLPVGILRYALQARWADGSVHEWVFPRVFHVLSDVI